MLLGLSGLTALFIAHRALDHAAPSATTSELLVCSRALLFPIVVLLGVFGVIVGILNSYETSRSPALAPVAWNIAIIVGLVIGVPRADATDAKL